MRMANTKKQIISGQKSNFLLMSTIHILINLQVLLLRKETAESKKTKLCSKEKTKTTILKLASTMSLSSFSLQMLPGF